MANIFNKVHYTLNTRQAMQVMIYIVLSVIMAMKDLQLKTASYISLLYNTRKSFISKINIPVKNLASLTCLSVKIIKVHITEAKQPGIYNDTSSSTTLMINIHHCLWNYLLITRAILPSIPPPLVHLTTVKHRFPELFVNTVMTLTKPFC